ncbi:hypothetical protein VTP01DRAFT_7283 [Rhizomucor pusillus]|uniref:uncharacterized protein n=1 Tax=Rhizomucor pusillus TaxID=4840 RepID=UPI003743241F
MAQLLYEDGHGNVVNENGRPEPMDYIVDRQQFTLKTITSHTQYLQNAAPKRPSQTNAMQVDKQKGEDSRMSEVAKKRAYVRYTAQDKARFFKLKIEKCMSASAAAKQLDIRIRTAQRWVKKYDECPDSIFESGKKRGRRRILYEEHKRTFTDFIDANHSAVVVEVTEHLVKQFNDLKVSRSTVYNFMRTECNLSLKKAEFQSVERNSPEKIQERYDCVREWEQTDMNFLTNCVFLDESAFHINMKRTKAWSKKGSPVLLLHQPREQKLRQYWALSLASGLIKVSLRIPRPNKKRKADQESEILTTDTVTGHYISFFERNVG